MNEPNWRSEVHELACDLHNEVDHGEAFYDKEMHEALLLKIERFKHACKQCYAQNEKEREDDE